MALQVWSCQSWLLELYVQTQFGERNTQQKRGKLDDKSEKTIFVGYSERSKAYKLYNPITKKSIISRDVSPITSHHDQGTTLSTSSSESPPKKGFRSLKNTYDNTRRIDLNDVADYALFSDADPKSYEEACQEEKWRDAMDKELEAIIKNDTWELVNPPKDHKSIGVEWIYKTKLNEKGEVDRYKARLVVKGYKQKYGIDYQEVFAPVIRLEIVRLVLAIAAQYNWKVYHIDVKSAFLNGNHEEDVFIDQPQEYVKKGEEYKVCHLKKALCGLK